MSVQKKRGVCRITDSLVMTSRDYVLYDTMPASNIISVLRSCLFTSKPTSFLKNTTRVLDLVSTFTMKSRRIKMVWSGSQGLVKYWDKVIWTLLLLAWLHFVVFFKKSCMLRRRSNSPKATDWVCSYCPILFEFIDYPALYEVWATCSGTPRLCVNIDKIISCFPGIGFTWHINIVVLQLPSSSCQPHWRYTRS